MLRVIRTWRITCRVLGHDDPAHPNPTHDRPKASSPSTSAGAQVRRGKAIVVLWNRRDYLERRVEQNPGDWHASRELAALDVAIEAVQEDLDAIHARERVFGARAVLLASATPRREP